MITAPFGEPLRYSVRLLLREGARDYNVTFTSKYFDSPKLSHFAFKGGSFLPPSSWLGLLEHFGQRADLALGLRLRGFRVGLLAAFKCGLGLDPRQNGRHFG